MTRIRLTATAVALAVALTGCGGDSDPEPAAAPTSAAPSPSPSALATLASPTPSASPSPTVDPNAPLRMGKSFTTLDKLATATVYAFKQPVAKGAPRPDEQPGYVWASADVKVCAGRNDEYPEGIIVTDGPWTLVYADDTQIEASNTGYQQFPEPGFPFGEKTLAAGRCVRGWITFPAPGNKRPVAVEYAPEDELVAPRWAVK